MKFICFNEWDQLPQSSGALFSQAEKDSLFFSRQWFENLVSTALEKNQSLLLVCVVEERNTERANDVLAILPLITCDNKEWTSLHHIYSSLYTLLVVENNRQEILSCMAMGLSHLPFITLNLEPVADDDYKINGLRDALESCGFSSVRYARFFNWQHPLHGQTFTEYMMARPSKVRNTIARKQRKLEREHGYEIRLFLGDDVNQGMADYYAVYGASWKTNERFIAVMEGFIGRFSALDWTRLAVLYVAGQPVAAQLWFVAHKKASIFKLAYDEAWKQYSPGSILTKYLLEYVIDTDKVKEIDFLTGNDRYKQDWMSERKQRWRVAITHKPAPIAEKMSIIGFLKQWLGK